MSTQVDKLSNKEFTAKPVLSRGQLESIEEDPSKMEVVARLMGAVNLDNLFRHMQNPQVNPMARIEFQKMLNKMGKLEPETKTDTGVGGPQVIINITRARDQSEGITIEGSSQAISDGA